MRIVLFSRVPRWYSFKNERLVTRLSNDGHEIAAVVVEQTSTLKSLSEWIGKFGPKVFIQKVLNKLKGNKIEVSNNSAPVSGISPKVFFVKSHNSAKCEGILKELQPEVIVLRGCGILKKPILDVPKIGVINPHYALLPAYRGMDVTEWSALHGDPIAVSVHTVNEGVDTGVVLKSKIIEPDPTDTTGTLRDKCAVIAVELISASLAEIEKKGTLPANRADIGAGKQYFKMHPRLKRLADRRLSLREQKHVPVRELARSKAG